MRNRPGQLSARGARDLLCGDDGAVTMVFAVCASLMIGTMCMAIDAIHYEMTQARMQMALDVATLSAGADLAHYDTTKPADLAQWQKDARAYYDVNMPSGYMSLNLKASDFAAQVTGAPATGQTIKLSATGTMPLIAPVIFANKSAQDGSGNSSGGQSPANPDTANVSASNAALRLPKSTLELVMVLDNTGSMSDYANSKDHSQGTKITGLRLAAQNLVNSLFSVTGNDSYIGLVPFTTMVNVKNALQPSGKWLSRTFAYNDQHMSMTPNSSWKGSGWGGCAVEPRDAQTYLHADAYQPASSPGFTPFYYNVPKNGFSVYSYTTSSKNGTTTCKISSSPTVTLGAPLTYLKSGSVTTSCGTTFSGKTPPAIYDQWYVNTSSTTTTTYDQNGNTNFGSNGPCNIASALFLSKDKSALTTAISNMQAGGSTLIPTGLLWGWRMLESAWSDNVAGTGNGFISTDTSLPRPETTQGLQRVVIVLSDGQNDPGGSTGIMPPQAFNGLSGVGKADLLAYNVTRADDGSLLTSPQRPGSMGQVGDLNAFQLAVCSAMKQDGIIIYSITFGDYGTDPGNAQATMQSCASPGNYYHAPSNATLDQIFQQIAGNLGVLRLTQ
jgi:Flp pilus assembly protein TadG